MAFMFYAVLVLLIVALLAYGFVRIDPARLAGGFGMAGPIVLAVLGVVLMLIGRSGMAGMVLSAAAAWFAASRRRQATTRSSGGRSTVRTAALEMELDHDTGALDGLVLAGRHEGRRLADLDLPAILEIHADLGADEESRQLLEAYLDGRFPVWRADRETDAHAGEGVAPRTGAMTEQEAYQVLGLEPGASAAEVRQAHRRLMQRVHPDLGGSSFLAARINEAKDVLLSHHG